MAAEQVQTLSKEMKEASPDAVESAKPENPNISASVHLQDDIGLAEDPKEPHLSISRC